MIRLKSVCENSFAKKLRTPSYCKQPESRVERQRRLDIGRVETGINYSYTCSYKGHHIFRIAKQETIKPPGPRTSSHLFPRKSKRVIDYYRHLETESVVEKLPPPQGYAPTAVAAARKSPGACHVSAPHPRPTNYGRRTDHVTSVFTHRFGSDGPLGCAILVSYWQTRSRGKSITTIFCLTCSTRVKPLFFLL